jgi:xylan 1,4-beta-xylosidase
VNLEGVLSWSFEFEDQPWFAGYRQLATNGVDLPVLNVFRLFAKLGNEKLVARSDAQVPLQQVMTDGVRGAADVGVLATRTANGDIAVLLWHYHDDDVPGPDAAVRVFVDGVRAKHGVAAQLFRIDGAHANSFAAWKAMGAPLSPDENQYRELETASALRAEVLEAKPQKRRLGLDIVIPRQGIALLMIPGGVS